MDSVNSFGHDQSIKPIPKPRRLRETVSLDNIEPHKSFRPVPYPRKLIGAFGLVEGPRLRANPPERPLPRPLFAFDATVVASGQLAQVDNSSPSVGSSDDGTSKDTVAESAIEVQRSSIEPSTELIDYPDSSKDVIDYSEERLCDKSKTRGECARPSPDMDSIRVMVEDITTKSGDDSRYSPTLRPEFSVPEEYATSPIVAELAHSADDTRHRAATERSGGGRFATIHGDVASVGSLSQCNSYATEAFESNYVGRAERRSQSQRGTKRCDPNSSISGRSSTGRRSFLKNLSSIFGQDRDSNSRQQQYFVPRKQLRSNLSSMLRCILEKLWFPLRNITMCSDELLKS